jgi:hypothetical protein
VNGENVVHGVEPNAIEDNIDTDLDAMDID